MNKVCYIIFHGTKHEDPPQIARSVLVDIEATQSDEEFDGSDDEATVMERERQAAESVPLRRRDEIDTVLQVARKWEMYAMQGERVAQEKQPHSKKIRKLKRKDPANPTYTPRSQKRARTQKPSPLPSPPPNTNPVDVDTCKGKVTIHVQVIPGESELAYELRVFELGLAAQRQADNEVVNMLRTAQVERQVANGIVPSVPLPSPPPLPPPLPSPPPETTQEEILSQYRSSHSPSPDARWLMNHHALSLDDDLGPPSPVIPYIPSFSLDDKWQDGAPSSPLLNPISSPMNHHALLLDGDWPGGAPTPILCRSPRSPSPIPLPLSPLMLNRALSPDNDWQGEALTPAGGATPVQRSRSLFLSQDWLDGPTEGVPIIARSPSHSLPVTIPLFSLGTDCDSPAPESNTR